MGAGRCIGAVVACAAVLAVAGAGCSDDDSSASDCVPADVVEQVDERAGATGVDRCAEGARDELEAIVVGQAIDELGAGAVAYADGGTAVAFEQVVGDASAFQGWFVDRTNRASFEDLDGDAEDDAVAAATDRWDDGRCRAGLLAWDALRHAEQETGRTDLLSDDQRTAWRSATGDGGAGGDGGDEPALTPYADMTAAQQDALCDANLNAVVASSGTNWGDSAEDAFSDVPPAS